MAGLRFTIHLDGFIPEDLNGIEVAGIKIPIEFAQNIPQIRLKVREIKAFVASMERKLQGEDLILNANYHVCYHNELPFKSCDLAQEI